MRRLLNALYALGAGLAALALLGIFLIMMTQVVMRELQLQLPAADDISAYLYVATTFFAPAATFKRGELIRVGMLLVAILDELVTVLRGSAPGYVVAAEERDTVSDRSAEV